MKWIRTGVFFLLTSLAAVLSLTVNASVTPNDSAALGAPVALQGTPTLNISNANSPSQTISSVVPSTGMGIGINTNACGDSSTDNSYDIIPTATGTNAPNMMGNPSPPYQMTGQPSGTTTSNTALPALLYSGHYMISYQATVQTQSNSTLAADYWVDDWATLPDSTQVRLLFTGDNPDQAPAPTSVASPGAAVPIYLHTIVYLPVGTIISYPRIWTVEDSSGAYPSFCVVANSGAPVAASTFTVTLLNVSY